MEIEQLRLWNKLCGLDPNTSEENLKHYVLGINDEIKRRADRETLEFLKKVGLI